MYLLGYINGRQESIKSTLQFFGRIVKSLSSILSELKLQSTFSVTEDEPRVHSRLPVVY